MLVSEQFYYFLIAEHFGHQSGKFSALFSLHKEHVVAALCNKVRNEQRKRGKKHHHKRDYDIVRYHENKRSDDSDDARKQLRKALYKPVGNLVYVAAYPRHKVAVRMRVRKTKRHVVQFFERESP